MANDITGPVWVIDTAATIVAKGTMLRIKGIAWVNGGAQNDSVVVTDGNGKLIWKSVATGANYTDRDAPSITVNGLIFTTLSSGQVFIEAN